MFSYFINGIVKTKLALITTTNRTKKEENKKEVLRTGCSTKSEILNELATSETEISTDGITTKCSPTFVTSTEELDQTTSKCKQFEVKNVLLNDWITAASSWFDDASNDLRNYQEDIGNGDGDKGNYDSPIKCKSNNNLCDFISDGNKCLQNTTTHKTSKEHEFNQKKKNSNSKDYGIKSINDEDILSNLNSLPNARCPDNLESSMINDFSMWSSDEEESKNEVVSDKMINEYELRKISDDLQTYQKDLGEDNEEEENCDSTTECISSSSLSGFISDPNKSIRSSDEEECKNEVISDKIFNEHEGNNFEEDDLNKPYDNGDTLLISVEGNQETDNEKHYQREHFVTPKNYASKLAYFDAIKKETELREIIKSKNSQNEKKHENENRNNSSSLVLQLPESCLADEQLQCNTPKKKEKPFKRSNPLTISFKPIFINPRFAYRRPLKSGLLNSTTYLPASKTLKKSDEDSNTDSIAQVAGCFPIKNFEASENYALKQELGNCESPFLNFEDGNCSDNSTCTKKDLRTKLNKITENSSTKLINDPKEEDRLLPLKESLLFLIALSFLVLYHIYLCAVND